MKYSPILVASALAIVCSACGGQASSVSGDPNLITVEPRDLQITIKEDAELQALQETVVRSEVEGSATIIYLAPEGSVVEKGALLVRLDASGLEDKLATQKINVGKAKAASEQAGKGLEILEKELITKRNTALSNLRVAEIELEKFLGKKTTKDGDSQGKNADMVTRLRELVQPPKPAADKPSTVDPQAKAAMPASTTNAKPAAKKGEDLVSKIDPTQYQSLIGTVVELLSTDEYSENPLERDMGDMANRVLQSVDQIRLAMADLKFQEAYYGHSLRLAQKKFLTPNELEKDQIEYQRRLSKVGLAWNDLDLLINYELFKDRIKLLQDVENAKLELERVEASNEADRLAKRTDFESQKSEYELAKERLENMERQIKNAEIYAPTPGLVIYARLERGRRSSESIREGVSVRERQELIILPDTTRMQAVVKVQEAVVSQVQTRQRAHLKVEAFADRVFTGTVTRVAQQADSNSGWLSSDRKVYSTTVVLDGENPNSELRSRMAAEVTILVDELEDVLAVPQQAVRRDRSVNYIWKQTESGPVATPVEVGEHNNEHVVIESGIVAGDQVYLAPPAGAQPPDLPQPDVPMPVIGAAAEAAVEENDSNDNSNRRSNSGGQGRERGGSGRGQNRGQGGGSSGFMGNLSEEQREQFNEMRKLGDQIKQFLLTKYPDRAEEIEDRRQIRQMYEEPEVLKALQNELGDPWKRYDQMSKQMRSMWGQGSRGGNR